MNENGKGLDNGEVLTIPDIVVDFPRNSGAPQEERKYSNGSGTKKTNEIMQERSDSINSNGLSNDVNNALKEFDKVLVDSEAKLEAINPENEYNNSSIFGKYAELDLHRKFSIVSTNSDLDQSREHRVQVQIHQTDIDEDAEYDEANIEGQVEDKVIETEKTIKENTGDQEDEEIEEQLVTSNISPPAPITNLIENEKRVDGLKIDEKVNIPLPPPIEGLPEDGKASNRSQLYSNNKVTEIFSSLSTIPPPPPIAGLLEEPPVSPKKIHETIRIDLSEISLKPVTPRSARFRSESIASEGPLENVHSGTNAYNKIKNKLNNIFQNSPTLILPDKNHFLADRSPSPNVEKESLDLIDKVIEQFDVAEEIPDDYGKTNEFRNELDNLLFRRESTRLQKSNTLENKLDNNDEVFEETEIKIPRVNKFRSIKSISDINILREEDEDTPISPEKDKQRHNKLMLTTLREIKLRRTAINMTDDDRTDTETGEPMEAPKTDDTEKTNTVS